MYLCEPYTQLTGKRTDIYASSNYRLRIGERFNFISGELLPLIKNNIRLPFDNDYDFTKTGTLSEILNS